MRKRLSAHASGTLDAVDNGDVKWGVTAAQLSNATAVADLYAESAAPG